MTRITKQFPIFSTASAIGTISLLLASGCTTKNYVRSQTTPVINHTNELDDATAANNRNIHDVDQRAQQGIQQAQSSANSANQQAQTASQSATQAQQSAQEAVNRADSLASVVGNLDSYKQVAMTSVNFGFDKADLSKVDKAELDDFAAQLNGARGYLLEVTGGTDSVGSAAYNYDLSQRRAQAVVQYLASKHNVPAHKFYLIGIGKDKEVATNSTPAGRAKNRRVDIQLLSNVNGQEPTAPGQTTSSLRMPAGSGNQ
ncbi:outer membrane protein OmpA-like peptidoglycan-associated protein [Silvibacterium bohemicum]|uniref:Outer membrane protein OmpA-like peptidoglycan-associated protein n=1 Tax=Silvibacterium bohemicum TaxID=1577686 RepID=A0A841JUZ6_9BACT|nr:OmpA family protein [Silvibacterium bohemicum]MBB6144980.1 outer membrane protein OmpA-like peptidoglycan-associated protein [Silvibacterium bohemicum]